MNGRDEKKEKKKGPDEIDDCLSLVASALLCGHI